MEEQLNNYIEYLYREEKNNPMYAPEVTQSRIDFRAGFNLAEELFKPKWIDAETLPNNDRTVLVRVKDCRRPEENVTDVTLSYFEKGVWFYDSGGVVNDGNGWQIIQWMEMPQ